MRRLLALVDIVAISVALTAAVYFGDQHDLVPDSPRILWLLPFLPVWLFLLKLYGLYDRDVKRISHMTVDDLPYIFHALVIGTLVMWVYYAWIPDLPTKLSFRELCIFSGTALVLLPIGRAIVRRGADRVVGPERAVFIGRAANVRLMIRKVRAHPEYGIDPVGLLHLPEHEPPREGEIDLPVLGTTERLPELVHLHDIERVVLASERDRRSRAARVAARLPGARAQGVDPARALRRDRAVGRGRRRRGPRRARPQPAGAVAHLALAEARHGPDRRDRGPDRRRRR